MKSWHLAALGFFVLGEPHIGVISWSRATRYLGALRCRKSEHGKDKYSHRQNLAYNRSLVLTYSYGGKYHHL
jgi:hypothetical protein